MSEHERFTPEALKSQVGKTVPVTLTPGGPVVGKATLEYDSDQRALHAQIKVTEPWVAEFLSTESPSVIFKQEGE